MSSYVPLWCKSNFSFLEGASHPDELVETAALNGLPALALAVDPPEADLMRRPPRRPRTGIFTRPIVVLMLAGGVWSTAWNGP